MPESPPPLDQLAAYDYELPTELIAHEPAPTRDAARLLVVDRRTGGIAHSRVSELPQWLQVGDALVMNNTRVLPARLQGRRTATSGRWEGLFLRELGPQIWEILSQTRGKIQPGEFVTLQMPSADGASQELPLELIERGPGGVWQVRHRSSLDMVTLLEQFGTLPLPPYITRAEPTSHDRERYQTVYAQEPGSVAAPTAGLHFTPELRAACRARGISESFVTLHVGLGTFRPISVESLDQHQMHSEWCTVPAETVTSIQQARAAGKRAVAVGTTTVRTLESAAAAGGLHPWTGETNIFIRPPYQFRAVDALLTNFHLPKSSLLVLLVAFAGHELVYRAYQIAIAERYRFFSYGDAMLVL